MINSKILDDVTSIKTYKEKAIQIANKNNIHFPFYYLDLPFIWWKNFNSQNDVDFGSRRGRNFWGYKSWLKDFKLLLTFEDDEIIGIVPLAVIYP